MKETDLDARLNAASRWAAADCDESDRRAVLSMVAERDAAVLENHFGQMLEFGTAGLRGAVGPGPGCMNRAMVRITTNAVASHLENQSGALKTGPVVLGYDARLTSRAFAEEAAGVLVARGFSVRYFETAMATPIVAYTLKRYGGIAGIVITASHNPKDDNGYKLYASNAIQIVSPTDTEIAVLMSAQANASEIECLEGALVGSSALAQPVEASIVNAYFQDIDALRPSHRLGRELPIVYTPLHGVGREPVMRALGAAGFSAVVVVPEQAEPDGTFPTAPNPNPEGPGVLDLAIALANETFAGLVLANDPDADRLAVCARANDGALRKLTGNQIGILLADAALARSASEKPLVVSSIVSTPMLESLAKKYGARCEKTLTGFKWVWNAALDLSESAGTDFVFGFEEALGYCVGEVVRDKDGISAALLMAELEAELRDVGSSILGKLEELYEEHGLWVSVQRAIKRESAEGAAQIRAAVDTLAAHPPKVLGGLSVNRVTDYRSGAEARPRWLGDAALVELSLEGGGRVLARPSGTEPLLKIYVDLPSPVPEGSSVWEFEAELCARALSIADEVRRVAGI
jgi:phosphomannomutase